MSVATSTSSTASNEVTPSISTTKSPSNLVEDPLLSALGGPSAVPDSNFPASTPLNASHSSAVQATPIVSDGDAAPAGLHLPSLPSNGATVEPLVSTGPPPAPSASSSVSSAVSSSVAGATPSAAVLAAVAASAEFVMEDTSDTDDDSDDENENEEMVPVLELTGDRDKDHAILSKLMKESAPSAVETDAMDEDDPVPTGPPRTANEQPEPPVEPLDLQELPSTAALGVAGTIYNVVGTTVVVQAPEVAQALQPSTVLCYSDRKVLGRIEDLFGPVSSPLYIIRYNREEDIDKTRAVEGAVVHYPLDQSRFVLADALRVPGSDASNIYDEEVAEDEQAFSDDEEEAAARAKIKEKKKANAGNRKGAHPKSAATNTKPATSSTSSAKPSAAPSPRHQGPAAQPQPPRPQSQPQQHHVQSHQQPAPAQQFMPPHLHMQPQPRPGPGPAYPMAYAPVQPGQPSVQQHMYYPQHHQQAQPQHPQQGPYPFNPQHQPHPGGPGPASYPPHAMAMQSMPMQMPMPIPMPMQHMFYPPPQHQAQQGQAHLQPPYGMAPGPAMPAGPYYPPPPHQPSALMMPFPHHMAMAPPGQMPMPPYAHAQPFQPPSFPNTQPPPRTV